MSCPTCRHRVELSECARSAFVETKISRIKVRCAHHEDGCDATFVMGKHERNLWDHNQKCLYQPAHCPDCRMEVQRRDLATHAATTCEQRLVVCDVCGDELRSFELKSHRDNELSCASMMRCPNGCTDDDYDSKAGGDKDDEGAERDEDEAEEQEGQEAELEDQEEVDGEDCGEQRVELRAAVVQRVPSGRPRVFERRALSAHLSQCPRQLVQCLFCGEQVQRAAMDEHIETSTATHLTTLLRRVHKLEDHIGRMVPPNQVSFDFTVRDVSVMGMASGGGAGVCPLHRLSAFLSVNFHSPLGKF